MDASWEPSEKLAQVPGRSGRNSPRGPRTCAQGSVVFLWRWLVGRRAALEGFTTPPIPSGHGFCLCPCPTCLLSLASFSPVDPLTLVWHLSREGVLRTEQPGEATDLSHGATA